jgi:RND superfamily putative drug exporter
MFRPLGKIVSRGWPAVLLLWIVIAVLLGRYAPNLNKVTVEGPGFTLPKGYDSQVASDLLAEGFGSQSSRLLILMRTKSGRPLTDENRTVIHEAFDYVGNPRNQKLWVANPPRNVIGDVISEFRNPYLKDRLTSTDNSTTIQIVVLTSQFSGLDTWEYVGGGGNKDKGVVNYLDQFVKDHPEVSYEITDSAAVGWDYNRIAEISLKRTQWATAILVVIMLLVLYRSPITPIVPLATLVLSLYVANCVMALLAQAGMEVPKLLPIFMVSIVFGSCTDYCLFLIGRFQEELARGRTRFEAVSVAVSQVGAAITASAGTTIAGLAMMAFADFAIFRTTGPGLGIGLFVGLLACLTFTPALMVVLGGHLFWPKKARLIDIEKTRSGRGWSRAAQLIVRRPGLILMLALLAFTPLAGFGGAVRPSYDLFSEFPPNTPSRRGNELLLAKFPESARSEQVTLALTSGADFGTHDRLVIVDEVGKTLEAQKEVIEVRSVTRPRGKVEPSLKEYLEGEPDDTLKRFKAAGVLNLALPRYVSQFRDDNITWYITRVDIVLRYDTFSQKAMDMSQQFKPMVKGVLEKIGAKDVNVKVGGLSAHMFDLAKITHSDLVRLRWMMLGVLYIIIVVLLRVVIAPIYMLGTMVVNYFTTLGIVHLIFVNVIGRQGLDWKVEFFLFVLLVAIGVDYNIYIMSRINEEGKKRPFPEGVRHAIVFTGSIISSCGIVMAGTFASMGVSPLSVMQEIGLGMAVGVMLDTYIIRPLVVPALALLVERVKDKLRGRRPSAPDNLT